MRHIGYDLGDNRAGGGKQRERGSHCGLHERAQSLPEIAVALESAYHAQADRDGNFRVAKTRRETRKVCEAEIATCHSPGFNRWLACLEALIGREQRQYKRTCVTVP